MVSSQGRGKPVSIHGIIQVTANAYTEKDVEGMKQRVLETIVDHGRLMTRPLSYK